ncbi:hypothetical protein Q4E93_23035 [Flavitalea sp. BT771]|uniref:hypothetical protein n=1 Tax=Flavitalea sp. BT771 TaxID=3063329 RepID=UPI0026E291D6|nr:hypothetical protein [Flavitalea sp. BT771]MDO6433507.1 hypothetical protein [Flavitalea sp. BT771]MDV6222588.1 hypothetical protein [Flavitalea sp. BT771]
MNNGNILLLKEKLRYLGFGEAIASSDRLDIEIQNGTAAFQLQTAACFDEWSTIQATLFFRKSDNFDMYFFIKFDALLICDTAPMITRRQTFHIKNGSGVTFKEAFNLLQGRSVITTLWDSDDAKYSTWIQLSFSQRTRDNTNYKVRQYGENYGYDLEKALSTYPIRELQDEKLKMNLLCSLQKGNVHPVTIVKANKMERMFVEACPAIPSDCFRW